MTTTSTRVFQLFSGLTLTLLQACGGAVDGGPGDFQVADEAVEQGDTDGNEAAGCPIPLICQLCDDGSCADHHVEMVDGECGPITYSCDSGENGNTSSGSAGSEDNGNTSSGAASPPDDLPCSVPAICQLCDDGACATPEVEYKDGKCGAVHFVCPGNIEGSEATGEAVDLDE